MVMTALAGDCDAGWKAAQGPLQTRWTAGVTPGNAHREYPRPQMAREEWLNLNGLWDYAIRPKDQGRPSPFDGPILVPFPIESALSGVMKRVDAGQRLWCRQSFRLPAKWEGRRIMLHFGAVDWEARVWVNGRCVGEHRGGYDPFSFDITARLKAGDMQEVLVCARDPADSGYQPRGKQVASPQGIWYTPTTGIWQTVWIEPVPATHVASLRIVPDVDRTRVVVTVVTDGPDRALPVEVTVRRGWRKAGRAGGMAGEPISIPVSGLRLWSPDDPFLYDLEVLLRDGRGRRVDRVSGYFGMRKISLGKDRNGVTRMMLNNEAVFQLGPLDQGFWPDGLYAAPCDDALRHDVEMTRKLGFNMARKHVKAEPERWYYWCDRLGLLVWQDMPSGDGFPKEGMREIERSSESAENYRHELKALVDALHNHPSIVMWVPFNEGWGQFETVRTSDWIAGYDPSRLVNCASGWHDFQGAGHVRDVHAYPGPEMPGPEEKRAAVLGEFGGLGLPVKGHTWQEEKNWGYRSFDDAQALTAAYLDLLEKLKPLAAKGLSAAVYTQTSDVEVEVNGLMTYDREIVKMDAARVARVNAKLIGCRRNLE